MKLKGKLQFLGILAQVGMAVSQIAGQLAGMIYNLVDAMEENKVLENSQTV